METEVYDYPLLNYPSLMLLVLRRAASGEASLADCFDCLEAALRGVGERLCAPETEVRERLARARTYLARAGLLECRRAGRFQITKRGRQVLADHPQGVDDSVLMGFAEFRDFIHRRGTAPHAAPGQEIYDHGFEDFHKGRSLADNPFDFDTAAHLAWEQGWFEALDENQIKNETRVDS